MAASLRSALLSASRFSSRYAALGVHFQNVTSKAATAQNARGAVSLFHTSSQRGGLMEFFDNEKNWGEESIKTGRPWRVEELRIKSNSDLHKLWYVLLKERNMLLTMQHEYEQQCELFPNPERIEKVEESMENIMQVMKERDEAYHLLETGKAREAGGRFLTNYLGLRVWKRYTEHLIPAFMNKAHRLLYPRYPHPRTAKYLALYREQRRKELSKERNKEQNRLRKLEQEFPHLKGKLVNKEKM